MPGGYTYGEAEPQAQCPYCGAWCSADFADIGVAFEQCGPFHCMTCHATEIGPYDDPRALSERERKSGWYEPGRPPGSSANVIGGKVVDHKTMRSAYEARFGNGNKDWHDPDIVRNWWAEIRREGAARIKRAPD